MHEVGKLLVTGMLLITCQADEPTQEKCCVNTDPFLHRNYTIGLYTV